MIRNIGLMKFAECPKCKMELEVEDVFDIEHCGDEIVIQVYGNCPKCNRPYRWEEIFIFHKARKIQENK